MTRAEEQGQPPWSPWKECGLTLLCRPLPPDLQKVSGKVGMGAVHWLRWPPCTLNVPDSGLHSGTLTLVSLVLAVGSRPSWKGASESYPFSVTLRCDYLSCNRNKRAK